MSSPDLPSPLAILTREQAASGELIIAAAPEAAREELDRQLNAFKLVEIFERFPRLAGFTFWGEHHFNGGPEQSLIRLHEPEIYGSSHSELDEGDDEEEDDRGLYQSLSAFLNAQPEPWFLAPPSYVISRPPSGEDLFEGVARQFLGPEAFARWQAAAMAAVAPSAAAPARGARLI